jgi:hypothetical protein
MVEMNEQLKTKWLEMAAREVSTQCMLARRAFDAITAAQGVQYPFILIQALLSHCANASKMLQALQEPQRMTRYEFGWRAVFARLRRWGLFRDGPTIGDLLGIDKSSPVHHRGRQFRNHLEHYDQRLFEWLSKYGPKVGIGDFNVVPKSMIKVKNMIWIRNLDPQTNAFTFVDKDLDLNALVAELDRIRAAADTHLATLN